MSTKTGVSLTSFPLLSQWRLHSEPCGAEAKGKCHTQHVPRELQAGAPGFILGGAKDESYPQEQFPSLRVGSVPITLLREETGKINPPKVMKCWHILLMRLYEYLR